MAEEAVLGTILSQVSKRILEKLEKGKRLSTEDILLLYLDMTYRRIESLEERLTEEIRSLRGEVRDTNTRIDELAKRIDETNKRIDKLYELLLNAARR